MLLRTSLLAAALALPLSAQTAVVQEAGLTMDGGILTVIYGQPCGGFTCTPLPGGNVGTGQSRTITAYGAPSALFAVALGFPASACLSFPGLGNALLLTPPMPTLGIGLTSPALNAFPCAGGVQGRGAVRLTVPAGAPTGLLLATQGLVLDYQGAPALTPAIAFQLL